MFTIEKIDHDNTYTILVPTKDKDFYTPNNPNFSIQTVDFKNYSFSIFSVELSLPFC